LVYLLLVGIASTKDSHQILADIKQLKEEADFILKEKEIKSLLKVDYELSIEFGKAPKSGVLIKPAFDKVVAYIQSQTGAKFSGESYVIPERYMTSLTRQLHMNGI